jgi:hypothetical protein
MDPARFGTVARRLVEERGATIVLTRRGSGSAARRSRARQLPPIASSTWLANRIS